MHALLGLLMSPFLRFEYYLVAWLEFLLLLMKGKTWSNRFTCLAGSWPQPPHQISRLAIFAAFHGPDVTLSNLGYLRCLQKAGFQVVYVHNGPISPSSLVQLKPLCVVVLERINLGQDIGSYKDAYLNLRRFGWLRSVEWLLFCNDSIYFLGDEAGANFAGKLDHQLSIIDEPVLALNENLQFWQYLQSFFVAVRSEVFDSAEFLRFWRSYLPLSHRYHAINQGEVRWSLRVLNRFPRRILYTPSALSDYASNALCNQKTLGFSRLLIPKCCGSLVDGFKRNFPEEFASKGKPRHATGFSGQYVAGYVYWDQLAPLLGILEGTNVSHSCALMFAALLGSPFLKKDICRHNVYTIVQIRQFLDWYFTINTEKPDALWREIVSSYESQGAYVSYRFRVRVALRKGLMYRGFGISKLSLPNFGNR